MSRREPPVSFPLAAAGDPERQRDQLQIEPEAAARHIQPVETKFAGARNVERCIHLCQAGESRSDAVAFLVAGKLPERDELPVASRLDFARTKRSRADEA